MSGAEAGFAAQIAQAARDRAASWAAVAEVLEGPGERLAEALRSGALAAAWRDAAGWVGDDAELFLADLMTLDTYARGSRRRTLADDVAALRAGCPADLFGAAGPGGAGGLAGAAGPGGAAAPTAAAHLAPHARHLADLCRAEADAWASGDVGRGRQLRAEEQDVITASLAARLPAVGRRLAQESSAQVWRALGRLVLAVLSVESGEDYHRAVLGERRGRDGR
ncbi:hypothetical protein MF406_13750 [Georgenia sp. TF02-10]|uniref:hypothetical protein n=1 Tax=Georgenia sp. TF02-10 TaxID=2917725 RepID=UPI001FA71B84|nr:hypothetical protein [Georgenia sp. TF02-10]UNX54009.1 hypothetical protein MF406_13750 [Georgenia sp. TF02-10]